MMLYGSRLKVVLVTVHLPLTEVAAALTRRRDPHHHRADSSVAAGVVRPGGAAVGGGPALNPHGGEDGMFGQEERRVIRPAVRDCSGRGMCVSGPVPADSLFHRAVAGEYDAVICMYHDQGLGPFKLLHFTDGVNLTLGLPIIRTSGGPWDRLRYRRQGRGRPPQHEAGDPAGGEAGTGQRSTAVGRRAATPWIPAFAGMTEREAGMTEPGAGMAESRRSD